MDAVEHQRCYIYTPPEHDERPVKRQRTSQADPQSRFAGRLEIYRDAWSRQEKRIKETLEEADGATQDQLVKFVAKPAQSDGSHIEAVPAGLVVVGPSIASHGPFFERIGRRIRGETNSGYIVLTSRECPNLKTLLKNLIKKATCRTEEDEDDDLDRPTVSSRNGPKLLDFDLGHLEQWQARSEVNSIVVVLQDSEAFDTNVLVETVDLFHSWRDRLPFVLLFGIATSVESFGERLPSKSLRYLQGGKFDVVQSDEIIEKLFAATYINHDVPFIIGPNITRRILERQRDHVQNVQDFRDGLKYAYMSHFYANDATIFLRDPSKWSEDIPSESLEAVRHFPSFRRLLEERLESNNRKIVEGVRSLLDSTDPAALTKHIGTSIGPLRSQLHGLSDASSVLFHVRQSLQMSPQAPLSSLWIRAAAAEMKGSPLLRETMLLVKKMPSDKFSSLLTSLRIGALWDDAEEKFKLDLDGYDDVLKILVSRNEGSGPLRTQHDVRNDSLRTTVVAQKVLLSKHKATLSEEDKAYSALATKFHDELDAYFSEAFVDPKTLFLSEILMYDFKSPHTEVFQPKPRFAIERALASPHDYLGCECCEPQGGRDGDATLSATQPATAILYQLYLESGSLINVSDLWSAFNAIAGGEGDDEEGESKTMALFQRSLAELKYLGLVKTSRKKTDHVVKMMWKGL